MTDRSDLDEFVAVALAQVDELVGLDGPRAEAWASDLLALAAELIPGDDSASVLVAALVAVGDDRAATALCAIGALVPDAGRIDWTAGAEPAWVNSIGSSRCDGAWVLSTDRSQSVVLRFVDSGEVAHIVSVDLIAPDNPDEQERVGEVAIGPAELLDVISDADAGIESSVVQPADAARRLAAALAATTHPSESVIANGHLLVARLATLVDDDLEVPVAGSTDVPAVEPRDTADDIYALNLLDRALVGREREPDPDRLTAAANHLRTAAANDEPIARWLAASVGPVDLASDDRTVVVSALAASIAPATLEPLLVVAQDAVVTLEWADWLGAVIELVRSGPGTPADGEALVDAINRCAEIASPIPASDRGRIAWAFDVCTETWPALGLCDGAVLTDFGVAVLPLVLRRAWAPA